MLHTFTYVVVADVPLLLLTDHPPLSSDCGGIGRCTTIRLPVVMMIVILAGYLKEVTNKPCVFVVVR